MRAPSRLLACLAFAAGLVACATDTPAPQLPADGGAEGPTDAVPGQDALAPGMDALAPGMDALAPGMDALPGQDAAPMPRPDSGIFDTCNPLAQDCPDMADKCRVEPAMPGAGATCVDSLATDRARGEVCLGGDCEGGLVCVNTGTVARCRQVCDRVTGEPCATLGADYDCRLQVRTTNWGACDQLPPLCDPVSLAPCSMTEACQPIRRFNGTFEFRCRTPGTGMEGQRCEMAGCARGLMCVNEEGVSLCRRACMAGGMDCPAPQACAGRVLTASYCR